ncbi:hypothetical protein, conserved [Babesia bigemina]|uniref:Transmembrane protein n=1 Tax=Babesia bigemina TaxID=5866 RepID=A0A061D4B4_BABBI|nr:hypothetical protein, conserved [Babesia bigemina]CDR95581.1 hypothetical protein, conserved [Babesia bigemina]|eukprot:XP_012767767.1 hypothetical protein, conserved [Babesia bigemina]
MARDRLWLSDVAEGVPATWYRSTFSAYVPTRREVETGVRSIPTQLVHPDGSFSVGVDVESIDPQKHGASRLQNGTVPVPCEPTHAATDEEEEEEYSLVVYASGREARKRAVAQDHPLILLSCTVYAVMVLWLGPFATLSPDATERTTTLLWLCWFSVLDVVALMCVLWYFGYFELLSINTALLACVLAVLLPHIESVYSVALAFAHVLTLLLTYYSLSKCEHRMFVIPNF